MKYQLQMLEKKQIIQILAGISGLIALFGILFFVGGDGKKFSAAITHDDTLPFGVRINNESKPWHFAVSIQGATQSSTKYGESSLVLSTTTADAYTSDNTYITLDATVQSDETIEWISDYSNAGSLQNPLTGKQCSTSNPCTGTTVQFYGGVLTGETSILLKNTTTGETIPYTIHTLPSSVEKISITSALQQDMFAGDTLSLGANIIYANGKFSSSEQENIQWEFSYDGGTTFTHNSSDGNISGNTFTPQKSGQVVLRAKKINQIASPSDGTINSTEQTILSDNNISVTIDEKPIRIERAKIEGTNTLSPNSTANVLVAISSPNQISNLQSLTISLIKSHINNDTWNQNMVPVITFREYQNQTNIKTYLENQGGKNWGLVEIPVSIPDYDPLLDMQPGQYTILAEVYTNETVVSRAFIPVILGSVIENSCDINNDGYKNVIDIILAMKTLNGAITPTEQERSRIDQNKNGEIDLQDIVVLFPCVLGTQVIPETQIVTQTQEYQATPTPTATPVQTPTTVPCSGDPILCLLGGG